jgi:hypothetical protein
MAKFAAARKPQSAEVDVGVGKASMHIKARMTPSGLLAIGGLVGGILLSVTALVWASTSVKRKHPIASALSRR